MTAAERRLPGWLEQVWLERYLERGLTPEETDWFEMYVLDKPHLLQRIENDADLRDGVAMAEGDLSFAQASGAALRSVPEQRDGRHPPRRWLALAAAVMVSAMGGWWSAMLLGSGTPGGSEDGVVLDPVRMVFDTQRGTQDPPMIFNATSESPWMLIEVGIPSGATDVRLEVDGAPPRPIAVTTEGFASFLWRRAHGNASAGSADVEVTYVSGGRRHVRAVSLNGVPES